MLEIILIPWATLGIVMPIAKMLGVAGRVHTRKKIGQKTTVRDIIDDAVHMQAAEGAAYEQVARAICGGDNAPEIAVKTAELAMKGITSFACPNVIDLLDGTPSENTPNS